MARKAGTLNVNFGNRDYEMAGIRFEQEREAGVRKVQAQLAQEGSAICTDCGEEIDAIRRRLMPSARRCTDCQQRVELWGR